MGVRNETSKMFCNIPINNNLSTILETDEQNTDKKLQIILNNECYQSEFKNCYQEFTIIVCLYTLCLHQVNIGHVKLFAKEKHSVIVMKQMTIRKVHL